MIILGRYFSSNKFTITKTCLVILSVIFIFGCTSEKKAVPFETAEISLGLLVPLESQDKSTNKLAEDLMNAARLAASDIKEVNLKLTAYPTSGSPERALLAADSAINRGSEILVGPLFAKETSAIKQVAHSSDVKIISFSNSMNIADSNTFIIGLTYQTISRKLVSHSVKQNLKRISILAPEVISGSEAIKAISNAIKENGAVLSSIETYPLNAAGIRDKSRAIFDNLVNSEVDAIIFTDTPNKGLVLITSQLSRMFIKNKERKPQFMGITRWDASLNLLKESSLQGGWFVTTDNKFRDLYSKKFLETFGTRPDPMSVLSYDAVAAVGAIALQSIKNGDEKLFSIEKFTVKNGFRGVDGIFRFTKKGLNERAVSVAEVTAGGFKIIDYAPKKFQSP